MTKKATKRSVKNVEIEMKIETDTEMTEVEIEIVMKGTDKH
jgi:hypothetical protein